MCIAVTDQAILPISLRNLAVWYLFDEARSQKGLLRHIRPAAVLRPREVARGYRAAIGPAPLDRLLDIFPAWRGVRGRDLGCGQETGSVIVPVR